MLAGVHEPPPKRLSVRFCAFESASSKLHLNATCGPRIAKGPDVCNGCRFSLGGRIRIRACWAAGSNRVFLATLLLSP